MVIKRQLHVSLILAIASLAVVLLASIASLSAKIASLEAQTTLQQATKELQTSNDANIMIQLQQLNQTLARENEQLQYNTLQHLNNTIDMVYRRLSQVIDNHVIYQQIAHSINITQELNIKLQMQLTRLIFEATIVPVT